jgi:5-methylcytosine-specific restriction enzyme A
VTWSKTREDRRQDAQRYGAAWRKARRRQLEADGYRCVLGLPGCTVRATTVDHIDGAASDPHHQRLRSLCEACHRKVTAQQGGGFRYPDRRADPEPRQSTLW